MEKDKEDEGMSFDTKVERVSGVCGGMRLVNDTDDAIIGGSKRVDGGAYDVTKYKLFTKNAYR